MKTYKTMKNNLLIFAALLLTGAAIFSCSSDNERSNPETPTASADTKTYVMTVEATKDAETRALTDGGTTLISTWTAGDVVKVYSSFDEIGELIAQSSGKSTTLHGTLTTKPSVGTHLTLKYLSPSYNSQDGTLTGSATSIDKVCDYSYAYVNVTSVDEIVTTSSASFINSQSVFKFTLKNKADNSAINATKLYVTADGQKYTVTPAAATNVLYVAIPRVSSRITLTAKAGATYYDYAANSLSFNAGRFYRVTAKLNEVKAMSQADASSIGRVIGVNGNIYVNVESAVNAGTDAGAIVAYVGSETGEAWNHGLALAMKDANNGSVCSWKTSYGILDNPNYYSSMTDALTARESGVSLSSGRNNSTWPAFMAAKNNTINTSTGISRSAPTGSSGWFLPSIYQWNKIVLSLTGKTEDLKWGISNNDYKQENLNSKITPCGGMGLSFGGYWASSEYSEDCAWFFDTEYGYAWDYQKSSSKYKYVRAALAF